MRHDDFGNGWWMWLPGLALESTSADRTFGRLGALEYRSLSLSEDSNPVAPKVGGGYDSYDAMPSERKSRR